MKRVSRWGLLVVAATAMIAVGCVLMYLAIRRRFEPLLLVPIGFGRRPIDGYGFGLGFSVLVDEDATRVPDNNGTYRWLGIATTYFWIDPEAEIIGMVLTQLFPSGIPLLEAQFQTLVYAALQN